MKEFQNQLNRMEDKVDKMYDIVSKHAVENEKRLSVLETRQKGMVAVGAALFTSIIGIILKKLGLGE